MISSKKIDLSFPFSGCLAVPYYEVDNCETMFQDFGKRFCPQMDVQIFRDQNRNVGFLKDQIYSICQFGFRFWSWGDTMWCLLYQTGVWYILYAIILTRGDTITVSINSKTPSTKWTLESQLVSWWFSSWEFPIVITLDTERKSIHCQ